MCTPSFCTPVNLPGTTSTSPSFLSSLPLFLIYSYFIFTFFRRNPSQSPLLCSKALRLHLLLMLLYPSNSLFLLVYLDFFFRCFAVCLPLACAGLRNPRRAAESQVCIAGARARARSNPISRLLGYTLSPLLSDKAKLKLEQLACFSFVLLSFWFKFVELYEITNFESICQISFFL